MSITLFIFAFHFNLFVMNLLLLCIILTIPLLFIICPICKRHKKDKLHIESLKKLSQELDQKIKEGVEFMAKWDEETERLRKELTDYYAKYPEREKFSRSFSESST